MKIIFAIVMMASLGRAQTLGEMSHPLPWRANTLAPVGGAANTWTGYEAQEISRLVGVLEFGGEGFISLKPELRTDALQILNDARRKGLSSAQGKEAAAHLIWRIGCMGWKALSSAHGDSLDGEDLEAMARLVGPPTATRWGMAKREFSISLERWHRERQ